MRPDCSGCTSCVSSQVIQSLGISRIVIVIASRRVEHGGMIQFGPDFLPQGTLAYLAFRASLAGTLKAYALAIEDSLEIDEPLGFLTEVPFLKWVAPQVQLDLLADCWSRHVAADVYRGNLVDEAVVYACCEFTAALTETQPESLPPLLAHGPRDVHLLGDPYLASELRSLYLNLSGEGDFLLISQFEDTDPLQAAHLKESFHMDVEEVDNLFDLLGRWGVRANLIGRLSGLLAPLEVERLAELLPLTWSSGR